MRRNKGSWSVWFFSPLDYKKDSMYWANKVIWVYWIRNSHTKCFKFNWMNCHRLDFTDHHFPRNESCIRILVHIMNIPSGKWKVIKVMNGNELSNTFFLSFFSVYIGRFLLILERKGRQFTGHSLLPITSFITFQLQLDLGSPFTTRCWNRHMNMNWTFA